MPTSWVLKFKAGSQSSFDAAVAKLIADFKDFDDPEIKEFFEGSVVVTLALIPEVGETRLHFLRTT